jgi:hypothetical protein
VNPLLVMGKWFWGKKKSEPADDVKVYIQVLVGTLRYNATSRQPTYIGMYFEVIKAKIVDRSLGWAS